MKRNFKITIEYDGSSYHGWQRQPRDVTVQGTLEEALGKIIGETPAVTGSGRTDAGVHAFGQVANFICDTRLEPGELLRALNSVLPDDIAIRDCIAAPDDFHARYDAKSKIYSYRLLNRKINSPILRRVVWHVRKKLNVEAMREAAGLFTGTLDFKSFAAAGDSRKTTVRTVMRSEIVERGDGLVIFETEANGFLRHMVRNMVGTLVDAGSGKISPAGVKAVIGARDRSLAGMTAPAQGLFLMKVKYDQPVKSLQSFQ